tara:strand:- start:2128 stop:2724 length:597 start_codon:yes stop_codon:yes gene_type:complete
MKSLILSLLIVTSCAYTSMELIPEKMQPLEDFGAKTMVNGNTLIFSIEKVVDERQDRNSVGLGKTGVSNLATPIHVQGGATNYVSVKLINGLKQRGISLTPSSENKLITRIDELWVGETSDGKVGEKSYCKIKLHFDLFLAGETLAKWSGDVSVSASSNGTLLDATSLNAKMLESCMNELLEKLIREPSFQNITGISI